MSLEFTQSVVSILSVSGLCHFFHSRRNPLPLSFCSSLVPGSHQSTFFFDTYLKFMFVYIHVFYVYLYLLRLAQKGDLELPSPPSKWWHVALHTTVVFYFWFMLEIESRASYTHVLCKCVHSRCFIQMELNQITWYFLSSVSLGVMLTRFVYICTMYYYPIHFYCQIVLLIYRTWCFCFSLDELIFPILGSFVYCYEGFVWVYFLISLGYILRIGIAWSCDNCA